jgi:integrase
VHRTEWIDIIERVSLFRAATGAHLHKALRAFLGHAVLINAINANPLARSKPPEGTFISHCRLTEEDLLVLMEIMQEWREPWRTIFGLMTATGESATEVSRIRSEDIDFDRAEWFKSCKPDRRASSKPSTLAVPLSAVAVSLLESYRDRTGYLFQSNDPRRLGQPIHVRAEIGRRIDERAHRPSPYFTIRRITEAVRRCAFHGEAPTRALVDEWSSRIVSYLNRWDDLVL